MKKNILSILCAASLSSLGLCAQEENTKVTIVQTEETSAVDSVESSIQQTRARLALIAHNNATVLKVFDGFA